MFARVDVVLSFHLSLYTVGELTRPKTVEYRLAPSSNGYIHDVHSPDVRPPVKGKTAKQGTVQRTLLNSETILLCSEWSLCRGLPVEVEGS